MQGISYHKRWQGATFALSGPKHTETIPASSFQGGNPARSGGVMLGNTSRNKVVADGVA
jgi:hypothetical protein